MADIMQSRFQRRQELARRQAMQDQNIAQAEQEGGATGAGIGGILGLIGAGVATVLSGGTALPVILGAAATGMSLGSAVGGAVGRGIGKESGEQEAMRLRNEQMAKRLENKNASLQNLTTQIGGSEELQNLEQSKRMENQLLAQGFTHQDNERYFEQAIQNMAQMPEDFREKYSKPLIAAYTAASIRAKQNKDIAGAPKIKTIGGL